MNSSKPFWLTLISQVGTFMYAVHQRASSGPALVKARAMTMAMLFYVLIKVTGAQQVQIGKKTRL